MVGVDSIIVMIVVGAIAGWLAGQIMRGFGYGLIWNIVIGIVGAFIGVWLMTTLRIMPLRRIPRLDHQRDDRSRRCCLRSSD